MAAPTPNKAKGHTMEELQRIEWGLILQDPDTGVIPTDYVANENKLASLSVGTFKIEDIGIRDYKDNVVISGFRTAKSLMCTHYMYYVAPIYCKLIGAKLDASAPQEIKEFYKRNKTTLDEYASTDENRRAYLDKLYPTKHNNWTGVDLVAKLKDVKWVTQLALVESHFSMVCYVINLEGTVSVLNNSETVALALDRFYDREVPGPFGSFMTEKTTDPYHEYKNILIAMLFIRLTGPSLRIYESPKYIGYIGTFPAITYQLILSGYDFSNSGFLTSMVTYLFSCQGEKCGRILESIRLILESGLESDVLLPILRIYWMNRRYSDITNLINLQLNDPTHQILGVKRVEVSEKDYTFIRFVHLLSDYLGSKDINSLSYAEDFKRIANINESQLVVIPSE